MALKLPGPRQVAVLKSFAPSLAVFGASAGTFLLFFTSSWKGQDLLQFVPIYNRKYEPKDPEMA